MALMVGEPVPSFRASAVVGGPASELIPPDAFRDVSLSDFRGSWLVMVFYPFDFSPICPTELVGFARHYAEFRAIDTEIIALSTDSTHSHLAWRRQDKRLRDIPYPLLADPGGAIASAYGVYNAKSGVAQRGTFVIDPEGTLQYLVVHSDSVGRSVVETLRVIDALQTNELCPCGWKKGDATLEDSRVEESGSRGV
jgi:peroxiredoxin (alkyl hydroperoxide reductase subunit C)